MKKPRKDAQEKKEKAAIAKYKARNHFHDEHWLEKQERAFTVWVNHVLVQGDGVSERSLDTVRADREREKEVALKGKEALAAFRLMTDKRKRDRVRGRFRVLFMKAAETIAAVEQVGLIGWFNANIHDSEWKKREREK